MRTRRSPRNQDRLYRDICRQLARAAFAAPPGYEADPELYACPDGPYCRDPLCLAENSREEARL